MEVAAEVREYWWFGAKAGIVGECVYMRGLEGSVAAGRRFGKERNGSAGKCGNDGR